jgi:hypothetical protein
MTLEELMGRDGVPPSFSLEYDSVYDGGGISLPQRVEISPSASQLVLSVLVEGPDSRFTVTYEQNGELFQEEHDRAAAEELVGRLRNEGLSWNVYAKQPSVEPTPEPKPQPDPHPDPQDPGDAPGPVGAGVDIITDLLDDAFQDGGLRTVFVVLQADKEGAPRSTYSFDADDHTCLTWRPVGETVPPFRYKITFLFAEQSPKTVEGIEQNPLLLLDPMQAD